MFLRKGKKFICGDCAGVHGASDMKCPYCGNVGFLPLEVIDAADVAYNWNDGGTTGNIKYNEEGEKELAIYTMVSNEDWGRIDAEDEEVEVEPTEEDNNG